MRKLYLYLFVACVLVAGQAWGGSFDTTYVAVDMEELRTSGIWWVNGDFGQVGARVDGDEQGILAYSQRGNIVVSVRLIYGQYSTPLVETQYLSRYDHILIKDFGTGENRFVSFKSRGGLFFFLSSYGPATIQVVYHVKGHTQTEGNRSADLNGDGEVNFADFLLFSRCFGMPLPCPVQ